MVGLRDEKADADGAHREQTGEFVRDNVETLPGTADRAHTHGVTTMGGVRGLVKCVR